MTVFRLLNKIKFRRCEHSYNITDYITAYEVEQTLLTESAVFRRVIQRGKQEVIKIIFK